MSQELRLPSGMVITIREPKNRDRNTVMDDFFDEKEGPGDIELLASYCLTSVNGQEIADPSPKHRMDPWDLRDVQFVQGAFIDAFYMMNQDAKAWVKAAANKIRESGKNELTLPSGKVVTFRNPRNSDRHAVLRLLGEDKGSRDVELLATMCLEMADGQPVPGDDLKTKLDNWSLRDVEAFRLVFMDLFFLSSAKDVEAMREAGKKLNAPAGNSGSTST